MNDLIQYGEVRRGDIGYLELSPVTTRLAEQLGAPGPRGALVTAMSRDAAAYRAGLQPGDVVVAVNGQTVDTPAQFTRMIQDARIGSTATLRVVRDGRQRDIMVPIQASSSRRRVRG